MSEEKKVPKEYIINSPIKKESNAQSDEQKKLNDLYNINFNDQKTFFIAKSVSNFKSILSNGNELKLNQNIKSIVIKSGEIFSKLKSDELSFFECKQIAQDKMKIMKTKEDVYLVLSYDNTSEMILLNCLKKLKELKINKFDDYKYCLPNILKIDENNYINVEVELNYKFVFNNISEVKNEFKHLLNSLFELSEINEDLKKKSKQYDFLIYQINEKGDIFLSKNEKKNEYLFYKKGLEFLKLYPLLKEFKNYKNNYPYDYFDNKVLYFGFLINSFYFFLVEEKENKIKIFTKYFEIIYLSKKWIKSIIDDLENELFNNEFFIKIRYLFVLFESKSQNFGTLIKNFTEHIFEQTNLFSKTDAEQFLTNRKLLDNIEKVNINKYNVTDECLIINERDFLVKYEYNSYPSRIAYLLTYSNDLLSPSWNNNSITNFQKHNFFEEKDINFLKKLLSQILSSNFFIDLEDNFIDQELFEGHLFDNEKKISEFLDNIIFAPFIPENLGMSGITFSEDLKIFISGLPFISFINFENYRIYKILYLSLMVIIILHECIHFCKRKLYYLTCGLISRETFLNGEREEGGFIFEKILLGWGDEANDKDYFNKNKILRSKKINIEIALKILNGNNYKNKIENFKYILYNNRNSEDFDDLLKEYLNEIGLNNSNKLKKFIEDNKNKTINAYRNYNEGLYVEYVQYDHRKLYSNNKNK